MRGMAGDPNPTGNLESTRQQRLTRHLFQRQERKRGPHSALLRAKPAGRGLDFDDYPENKSDFVRYAVELRCLNPVVDTKKTPLPPVEDLAEAVNVLLRVGLQ